MRRIKYISVAAIAALLVLITLITLMTSGIKVYAATTLYTSALEDLQRDSSFDFEAYPVDDKDYSLKVIQIAESSDGELFIYVYQPCARGKDLRATTIRLSQTTGINISPKDYKLTFLNSSGVFYKYKVEGLELKKSVVRYYDITAIHRPFDKLIDEGVGGGNIVNEVVYKVGQVWTATTLDGKVSYVMDETETIEITNKYVGFAQYDEGTKVGWGITNGTTRAHFIAFSTNHNIDKLISVDVGFKEQSVSCKLCLNPIHLNHDYKEYHDYKFGEQYQHQPDPLTIHYTDKVTADKYTWNRIRSTADFLKDEINKDYVITSDGLKDISGTQWILNFYETQVEVKVDGIWTLLLSSWASLFVGDADVRYNRVSDVTILRLSFETNGDYYNLGVVDNKQTGSGKPINVSTKDPSDVPWWVWVLIVAAVVIVALILICVFVPGAAPAIGRGMLLIGKGIIFGIYYLFYGLFWVVSLPFRGIAFLYKKMKKRLYEKGKQKEYVRQQKLNRKASMEVARYQNTLVRKEQVRQDKLKFKDEVKAEQRKSKQATKSANKRKKKSAKQRKKGGKKK